MSREQPRVAERAFGVELLVRTIVDRSRARNALPAERAMHRVLLVAAGSVALHTRGPDTGWHTTILRPGELHVDGAGAATNGHELYWQRRSDCELRLIQVELAAGVSERVARENGAALAGQRAGVRTGVRDPLVQQLAIALAELVVSASDADADAAFAAAAGDLLAVQLQRHHAQRPSRSAPMGGGLTPLRLRRVQDYVACNLGAALPLRALAERAGLSTYHFIRAFKASTGETPHRYVQQRRLEEAQRLLRQSELPIHEVALAVGYATQAHLTTSLRRATGMTPRQIRAS